MTETELYELFTTISQDYFQKEPTHHIRTLVALSEAPEYMLDNSGVLKVSPELYIAYFEPRASIKPLTAWKKYHKEITLCVWRNKGNVGVTTLKASHYVKTGDSPCMKTNAFKMLDRYFSLTTGQKGEIKPRVMDRFDIDRVRVHLEKVDKGL